MKKMTSIIGSSLIKITRRGRYICQLQWFNHKPFKAVDQPLTHTEPTCDAKVHYTKKEDTPPKLTPEGKLFTRQMASAFLCYVRVVESTMLLSGLEVNRQLAHPNTAHIVKLSSKIKIKTEPCISGQVHNYQLLLKTQRWQPEQILMVRQQQRTALSHHCLQMSPLWNPFRW